MLVEPERHAVRTSGSTRTRRGRAVPGRGDAPRVPTARCPLRRRGPPSRAWDEPYRCASRIQTVARFRDNAMLQTRDGRLFLGAQSLDSVAIGVAQVALPWLVLDATGSEAQAGLVFMLGLAPYVVFGLPAGLIADRFRRQTVIWMAHAFQAVVAVIVPIWAIFATPPIFGRRDHRVRGRQRARVLRCRRVRRHLEPDRPRAVLVRPGDPRRVVVDRPRRRAGHRRCADRPRRRGGCAGRAGSRVRGGGGADPAGAVELRRPGAVGGRRAGWHVGRRVVPAQGPHAAHAERHRHAVEPRGRRIVRARRAAAARGDGPLGAPGRAPRSQPERWRASWRRRRCTASRSAGAARSST